MTGPMRHDELQDMLAVYALDAVDGDEAALVEEHLAACPRCRAEVAEHRSVTGMLAHTGSPAPDGLWDRIAESLDEAPPELPLARVLQIDARRRSRKLVGRVLGAAAAATIALLAVAVVRQEQRIDDLPGLGGRAGLDQAAQAALLDPDSREVRLASLDGRLRARAVIGEDGESYLVVDNLPTLPEHRVYQLWAFSGPTAVSLGVLGNDPGIERFRVADGVTTLAITEEEAPGVVESDKAAVVTGAVA